MTALPTELKEINIDDKNQQNISEDYKRLWRDAIYKNWDGYYHDIHAWEP